MSTDPRPTDAEHRRWLIGLSISIAFGTFGAVMAWLSYSARTRPPSTVQIVRPASGDSDPDRARHRKGGERRQPAGAAR